MSQPPLNQPSDSYSSYYPPTTTVTNQLDGATDPADLTRPLYGASFITAVKRLFKNYVKFTGRASRSEYWWAQLAYFLAMLIPIAIVIAGAVSNAQWAASQPKPEYSFDPNTGHQFLVNNPVVLENAPGLGMLQLGFALAGLVGLVFFLPMLGAGVRRLHDANFSGLLFLLALIPGLGGLVLLVLMLLPSNPEGRRYDPDYVARY